MQQAAQRLHIRGKTKCAGLHKLALCLPLLSMCAVAFNDVRMKATSVLQF